ncbi:SRPBCC family protein [Kribbella sp. CA-253562]|uniref:SRPBCC family protein n=1 Tax=Kribbella sp. CA-253562 TaxID=3239942 RepID=UPI003D8B1D0B
MPTASASVELAATPAQALEAFWDLDTWRAVWDRIEQVGVSYADPCQQEFVMLVERDGRVERVRTVRYRRRREIELFSPDPPPGMRRHTGAWVFDPIATGARVTAVRHYELLPNGRADGFHERFGLRLQAILDQFAVAFAAGPTAVTR